MIHVLLHKITQRNEQWLFDYDFWRANASKLLFTMHIRHRGRMASRHHHAAKEQLVSVYSSHLATC